MEISLEGCPNKFSRVFPGAFHGCVRGEFRGAVPAGFSQEVFQEVKFLDGGFDGGLH